MCFTADKLKSWLVFLLDNLYCHFGSDTILRQRIGIPMGTNCAVFIANLFCFTYEYAFISHLVSTQNISLLRKCMLVARLVDDIFVPNFPEFHSYRYTTDNDSHVQAGIYPPFLELTLEQSANSNVSFLDTTTLLDNGVYYTKTYDKREHPPLSRINQTKFPHASSFLSSRSKFGIVTSQLMRFSRVCTREQDFTYRARKFLSYFLKQMHSPKTTRKYVLKFLRRVPVSFPFGNAKHLVRSLFSGL